MSAGTEADTTATPEVRERIRGRIRERLRARGLDAYVAYTPSNVFYATGLQSYFLSEWWRMFGTVMAVVPADEDLAPAIMISDFEEAAARSASGFEDVRTYPMWVETRDVAQLRPDGAGPQPPGGRPAQYDEADQDRIMASILRDRGLASGRVGIDLRYALHDSIERLRAALPDVEWVDATDDLYAVRAVKEPFEVERLRRATELSEAGMRHAVANLEPGVRPSDVRHLYTIGVYDAARRDRRYDGCTDAWVLPAVGAGVTIGVDTERGHGLAPGDLVKFDCGVTLEGYRSDGGRTFTFREARPSATELYDVLAGAHAAARERLRRGIPVREVFEAAQGHVRAHGYPGYTRGHVGHSVGIDTFHEEPPYLGPHEPALLQAGMVLAVETPAYTTDVGAIMIEDLVHITEDGHEVLHTLPYDLQVVG